MKKLDVKISSLFPAYDKQVNSNQTEDSQAEWLTNSSFTSEAFKASQDHRCTVSQNEEKGADSLLPAEVLQRHTKNKKKAQTKKKKLKNRSSNESHVKSKLELIATWKEEKLPDILVIDTRPDPDNFALGYSDPNQVPRWAAKITLLDSEDERMQRNQKLKVKKKKYYRYFSSKTSKILNQHFTTEKVSDTAKLTFCAPLPSQVKLSTVKTTQINADSQSDIQDLQQNNLTSLEFEFQNRTANFNRAITQSPHDIDLWLRFVEFQEEIFRQQSSFDTKVLNESTMLEKQICILDKALKHNPNSIDLSVAKLKLLQNLHDMDEMIKLWENLVFYHPNNVVVWKNYIQFLQSNVLYFNIPRAIKLYEKCLKTLSNVHNGVIKSHRAPPDLLNGMLDVFSGLCNILWSSGYMEQAVGTFQAFVEFNFFAPPYMNDVCLEEGTDPTTFFEPFWDSGAPRIGEKNAVGWSVTVTERRINENVANIPTNLTEWEDRILGAKLSKWKTWLEFEKLRQSNHWLPWRCNAHLEENTEDLEDPERIVSFDQVSPFLFQVRDEGTRFYLLCKFVSFLEVNIHSLECPFLHSMFSENAVFCEDYSFLSSMLKDITPKGFSVASLDFTTYTDFAESQNFIDSVFQQAIETFEDSYKTLVSLMWLRDRVNIALNADLSNCKEAKKFAKTLLKKKENRNCLFLWSEYVRLEWLSGAKEKANAVFESLLASSTCTSTETTVGLNELCYFIKNYLSLITGHNESHLNVPAHDEVCHKVVWILANVGSKNKYTVYAKDQKYSPALVVKAMAEFKKLISNVMEQLELSQDTVECCYCIHPLSQPLLNYAACSMYLYYFAQGIASFMDHFNDIQKSLSDLAKEKKTLHLRYLEEQLHISKMEILYLDSLNEHRHSLANYFDSSLFETLELFPNNMKLMYLLLRSKMKPGSLWQMRRSLFKLTKKRNLGSNTWFFVILLEMLASHHYSVSMEMLDYGSDVENNTMATEIELLKTSGSFHRVYNSFEQALTCPATKNCVAFWRFCVRFHVMSGNKSKARAIFHEALRTCPWSKALYMDGIQYFPSNSEEFIKMMSEKQVRVRTLPEEIALLIEHSHDD